VHRHVPGLAIATPDFRRRRYDRSIDDLTGFLEIVDGRVKTLHSQLHAGLLAVRGARAHLARGRNAAIWAAVANVGSGGGTRDLARSGDP
jgi:hypothetical protein